jgi:hypothetical protein
VRGYCGRCTELSQRYGQEGSVVETHTASVVSGALGSLSTKVEDDDSYLKPLPVWHKLLRGEKTPSRVRVQSRSGIDESEVK